MVIALMRAVAAWNSTRPVTALFWSHSRQRRKQTKIDQSLCKTNNIWCWFKHPSLEPKRFSAAGTYPANAGWLLQSDAAD